MTVENKTLKHKEQWYHRLPIGSLARQRGAIGIFGAMVLLLSVLFTALAVDTGRLMLEQRRLQSVADMAALDASSQSGHCGDGELATAQAAAEASAARNGHPVGGTRTLAVALGNTSPGADGVRVFEPDDSETAVSVKVTAGNTVPASLLAGGLFGEQVILQASAVAKRQVLAGFSAGSGLASLNTENSELLNLLLGGILRSTVNLDLVSYQGIASTNVTLLELVEAEATVGSVTGLLAADLRVGELLQIYADAANASGAVDVGAIIAGIPISAEISSLEVTLGEILAVTAPDMEAAASASVNLLDLITTTALFANGEHALTLPLSVNLPGGLLNVTANLEVIEPPKIAIGPPGKDENGDWYTEVKTAQVRLNSTVKSDINLILAQAEVDLALRVEVAQGSAWLQSIQCRNQENSKSIVTIGAQPGIASVALGATDPEASAAAIRVKLLGIPIANVAAGLNLPLSNHPGETELEYEADADELPMVQRASSSVGGSLSNGLSGLTDSLVVEVTLLNIPVISLLTTLLNVIIPGENDILGAVLGNLLAPLLTQLSTVILDPLLRVLGIEVGYLDVQLIDLEIESQRPELLI
jgi:uncharacterized membrane protein